jgi:hypothetical protein
MVTATTHGSSDHWYLVRMYLQVLVPTSTVCDRQEVSFESGILYVVCTTYR